MKKMRWRWAVVGWVMGWAALVGCTDGCQTSSEEVEAEGPPPATVKMQFGTFHACVLDEAQNIWCVGQNDRGQLGDGSTSSQSQLVQVYGDQEWVDVAVGYFDVTCGIDERSELYCWGNNAHGMLADDGLEMSSLPVPIEGMGEVRQVALGTSHGCALNEEGEVYCWGRNEQGQLGLGPDLPPVVWEPTRVEGLEGVEQVQVGAEYGCALTEGGEIYCWGTTVQGQVGADIFGELYADRPRQVSVEEDGESKQAKALAVGFDHACALFGERRQLYCWGRNRYGQLGLSDLDSRNAPAKVVEMAYVDEVAVATGQSCARIEDQVYCAGEVFVEADEVEAGDGGTYFSPSHALRQAETLWSGVVGVCGPAGGPQGDAVACRGVQRSDDWYGE